MIRWWGIAGLGLFSIVGCSQTPGLPSETYPGFSAYQAAPYHRAFAIGKTGCTNRWVCGDAWTYYSATGKGSPEDAKADALVGCKGIATIKPDMNPASCRIYAVDDEIVIGSGGLEPTLRDGVVEGH